MLAGLSQRMVIITIMRYFLIKQEQSIHQKYSLKLLFQQRGNEVAGITFNINVKAEFIQSDNFTPVTDEAGNITGWGNVAIEKSLK